MQRIFKLIGVFALFASALCAAPNYYLFDGDANAGYQIDPGTGTLVNSFNTFAIGYAPAIIGNVIRLGDRDAGTGAEYDLNGVPTGVTFTGGGLFSQLLDGTSDGTYNYAVECCNGGNRVMRADLMWQNEEAIFFIPGDGAGITFDSVFGTLWVAFFDGTVNQYTLAGVPISSFTVADGGIGAALAYDAATDTLWLHPRSGNTVQQYGKDGTLLQTVQIDGWEPSNVWGGEIANEAATATPEPSTLGLFGIGVAACIFGRRKQ